MTKFNDFVEEQKKDEKFREEYDALEPEFSIIQATLDERKASSLTT